MQPQLHPMKIPVIHRCKDRDKKLIAQSHDMGKFAVFRSQNVGIWSCGINE